MSLVAKLAFQFSRPVQNKGYELFRAGKVEVVQSNSQNLRAQVQGGQLYAVALQLSGNSLGVVCECAAFLDFGACKHIWAAILQADQVGAVTDARHTTRLQVHADWRTYEDWDRFGVGWRRAKPAKRVPNWQIAFDSIKRDAESRPAPPPLWQPGAEILYSINAAASKAQNALVVELFTRSPKKSGGMSVYKPWHATPAIAEAIPDPIDSEMVMLLLGGQDYYDYTYYNSSSGQTRKLLSNALATKILPAVAGSGRLALRERNDTTFEPLSWDNGGTWSFRMQVRREGERWSLSGALRRGDEIISLRDAGLMLEHFFIARGKVARLDAGGAQAWLTHLAQVHEIPFEESDREAVMAKLLASPVLPPLDVDDEMRFQEQPGQPRFGLRLKQSQYGAQRDFEARLIVDYGRGWVEDPVGAAGIWLPEERLFVTRNRSAEDTARLHLAEIGLAPMQTNRASWSVSASWMPRVVRQLLGEGWHVEAEGKAFRPAGKTSMSVSSGIDWFELHGSVEYGGAVATLPELLAALRRGDNMVQLSDGSFGILPEEWLAKFAPLAAMGDESGQHLRFRRSQAGLLDALLAAQPEVQVDEIFARVRDRIRGFAGVKALPQPEGFQGQLRDYQREGLGWMEFLREFGFGGCLADDMGVGKTAQVLAMLQSRRAEKPGPSLVVAPRSLMFNWRAEATKFTPDLRVIEHTGTSRDIAVIDEYDIVLTTYGTLLRDAPHLAEREFDYVILDEAQAIKNASTASAKAVRLMRARHRLALSGTPVENHLGELWSLFEFLNPGMLGGAKVLNMTGGLARNPTEEVRKILAHALRPFILRRTKQQVVRELPEKTEQTIYCELEGAQKKQYDELRRHYRDSLLTRVATDGMAKSKMHVLEALLRLRQAACHPGLIDEKRVDQPSAKLEVLLAHINEVLEEGHKALVFSQFTSLLAIVRDHLDAAKIRYEYLDGQTRDRAARVESFQSDDDCGLFLISLKAGGLGLNLTAAEYVFLLDPWWNPAVEAQAIDRTHRIGQTRPVFAYRLIARDTVEEKVLQLQQSKRELADAILGEDKSLIRAMKREDLELLLS